jgi:hypothetical protein
MADRLTRATRLLIHHFIPFMTKCLLTTFPYEQCYRPYFAGRGSIEKYRAAYSLLSPELLDLCQEEPFFHAIWLACEADSTSAVDRDLREEGVPTVAAVEDEPSTTYSSAPLVIETTDANTLPSSSPDRREGTPEMMGDGEEPAEGPNNVIDRPEEEKDPDLAL